MLHMINPDYELIGTVTDEQSGMELIRKKQPDLVIIDVDLSGGRGLEMLGRLQKGRKCLRGTYPDRECRIFFGAYGHGIRRSELSAEAGADAGIIRSVKAGRDAV